MRHEFLFNYLSLFFLYVCLAFCTCVWRSLLLQHHLFYPGRIARSNSIYKGFIRRVTTATLRTGSEIGVDMTHFFSAYGKQQFELWRSRRGCKNTVPPPGSFFSSPNFATGAPGRISGHPRRQHGGDVLPLFWRRVGRGKSSPARTPPCFPKHGGDWNVPFLPTRKVTVRSCGIVKNCFGVL